jgi:hypothetical protein
VGPVDLTLRQAFGAIKIGIRQIRVVEPCQPQIRGQSCWCLSNGGDPDVPVWSKIRHADI